MPELVAQRPSRIEINIAVAQENGQHWTAQDEGPVAELKKTPAISCSALQRVGQWSGGANSVAGE